MYTQEITLFFVVAATGATSCETRVAGMFDEGKVSGMYIICD